MDPNNSREKIYPDDVGNVAENVSLFYVGELPSNNNPIRATVLEYNYTTEY